MRVSRGSVVASEPGGDKAGKKIPAPRFPLPFGKEMGRVEGTSMWAGCCEGWWRMEIEGSQ